MDTRYVGANALDDPEAGLMQRFSGSRAGMTPQAMPQPMAPLQRSAPPATQGPAALPVAPLAQAPTRPAAPASRPPVTMEMRNQAYRKAMRKDYPDMDEQDFEQHVQYGLAKQHGRMAAAQAKTVAKPLARYWSMLQQQQNAALAYKQLHTRLASKKYEYTDKATGLKTPEWAPYQDQLNASRMKLDEYEARTQQYGDELKKMGITAKDLANPLTIHSYQRSLAEADPSSADAFEDDTDMAPNAP